MFKAARWRSDKNKIKVVFKLQFQATQVPLSGAEGVTVSLVPLDVGKPTVRSERVSAIGGTCKWLNPIYETVKLVRDPKSGKINEKLYKFLVSAVGSARAGFLGEATINLADYVEIFKATSVSLPLMAGALLNVTIRRIQGDVGEREANGNEDATVRLEGRTLQNQLSKCDDEEGVRALKDMNDMNLVKDGSHINRERGLRLQSSRNLPTYADSSSRIEKSHSFGAISVTSSDSGSEIYNLRENNIDNGSMQKDSPILLSHLANIDVRPKLTRISGGWSGTSVPDRSTDGSTHSSGESGLTERLQCSDETLEKLQCDVLFLTRKVEVSELELQTLRKQIVKENKRGQDLSREISQLKGERDALQRECEELKLSQMRTNESQTELEDPLSKIEEIKQELDHENNLNASLRLQLQKTQEANSELLLAVRDLDDLLEQKNRETPCHNCCKTDVKAEIYDDRQGMEFGNRLPQFQQYECNQELPQTTLDTSQAQYAFNTLVDEHNHMSLAYSLEKNIIDLNSEIELYKKDREGLEVQMEQLALDYEILKQENHDVSSKLEETQLREQLRMQYECSAHTTIISNLEAHVGCLEKELQTRSESFESDVDIIMKAKTEQEKKALQAEDALRKTRWINVNIAEQLHGELTRLSSQASSLFCENEKIIKQALEEASELRSQRSYLVRILENTKENLASVRIQYHKNLCQLVYLQNYKLKETDKLRLELENRNEEFENYKKFQESRQKDSLEKMQLLETEIEMIKMEKYLISEQKEKLEEKIEILETANKENKVMLQNNDSENEILKKEIAQLKQEIEKSLEEILDLRNMRDEKENIITQLNSEVESLELHFSDLKRSLSEGEQEKEKLRRLVSNLTGGLLKEEATITSSEEIANTFTDEEKHCCERPDCVGKNESECDVNFLRLRVGEKAHMNGINSEVQELVTRSSGTNSEEQQLVVSCTCDQHKLAELLSKMALLKQHNEQMEADLKEMQERYSGISLKFAEVEGERQKLVMTIRTLKNALKN
ncbi:hypothetical protein Cni_G18879 [Canna indica]|uniref:C2 NT-type domain-containing protein n=1 Tax=Canna indica TaxID=4628 RepID=A0AAQ3QJ70_9LILI|nr:hypothetical protein Cni_G18879 [Canna indica]